MRYLPYAAASSEPNIIVDGTANDRTLITLSHWRRSGAPAELMADTSTGIVINYLDRPDLHVAADVVSNNHFDEDGLVGIYALLEPDAAASRRDLLIDVAQAGDFGVFRSRRAARIAFAISAHADPATSPFPRSLFDRPAPRCGPAPRPGIRNRSASGLSLSQLVRPCSPVQTLEDPKRNRRTGNEKAGAAAGPWPWRQARR